MEPASEGRGAVSRRLGNWRLRRGPEAAPVTGTPGRLLHSLAGGARSCAASVPSVQPDARLGHEPMRGSGGSGGHGAGRGRRKRRAAAAHGAPPGVLLPAAGAQPFRAADADGRCQAHPELLSWNHSASNSYLTACINFTAGMAICCNFNSVLS